VVFVDHQAVVAEPIGEHEFVDIFLVELVADLRIESSIGDIDPLPLRSTRLSAITSGAAGRPLLLSDIRVLTKDLIALDGTVDDDVSDVNTTWPNSRAKD
jgi:hypothetical protein